MENPADNPREVALVVAEWTPGTCTLWGKLDLKKTNKCLWHMHSKVCYRKICLCHCFMVIAQTHVQAVATVH